MQFTNINIGKRLAITFGVITLLMITLIFVSYRALEGISERWEQYRNVTLEKYDAAYQGESHLGDAIHHFKNYLLRAQDYDKKFLADIEAIDGSVTAYAKRGNMNEREKLALERVAKGAETYRAAIKKAVEMKTANASIEEIDKSIKGADKEINNAFDELLVIMREETKAASQSITDIANSGHRIIVAVGILTVLLSTLFVWLTSNSITRPLKEAIITAQTVASGDLTSRIEVKSKDETGQLLQALKDMNESLSGIVGDVRGATDSITTASKQIAVGNSDLSQRTEEQASSLEETASSMEELTSTVRQNAENAKQANQLAASASDVAVKGGQVVGQVVQTMTSISDSSKKIVDIISVIEGIAFQTNILALNAAVEAARAGEQGRGFAVVAGEVRNLAQRSAAAAKEIKTLIGDSVDKVGAGAKLVDQAGATMSEIVSAVKRVTDIMSEISAASTEQSAGIEQVNQAITQMDEVTQQNAALVEEAAAAAESMQEQANTLMEAISIFKLEAVTGRQIRTATTKPVHTMAASAHSAPRRAVSSTAGAAVKRIAKLTKAADGTEEWKEF